MANPIVVDLSHWNPTPDWKKLFDGGTMGVIHKCTEGTGYVDPEYGHRYIDAIEAGLLWGAYHFLKHGDITKQMQWYVSRAGLAPGGRAIIDFEDAKTTLDDLVAAVNWLFDYGCEVCVYGDGHLTDTLKKGTSAVLERTSLWQARYSSSQPKVPPPWSYWSMWQYTEKAQVSGISAPVDGNKWNGTEENLILWFNGAAVAPIPPEPEPTPKPKPDAGTVTIDITVPDGIDIVVMINGEMRIVS